MLEDYREAYRWSREEKGAGIFIALVFAIAVVPVEREMDKLEDELHDPVYPVFVEVEK